MSIKEKVNEELSKLIFLELKKDNYLGNYYIAHNIFVPIKATSMVNRIKSGDKMDKIPISAFIEGMCYVIGADPEFKFKTEYVEMLSSIEQSEDFIKKKIFDKVKSKEYQEAYILIKGLLNIENSKDVYDKTFLLLENLVQLDKDYIEEELYVIEQAKKLSNYATPYLYEAIVNRETGNYEKALIAIHTYLEKGGKETIEVTELKENLININKFNKGKELSITDPEECLKHLLPLIECYGDSPNLYYHIAVAYRNLENYAKAIYYLNEAWTIDNALIEVLNEYGINYASLGEFNKAVMYFEKAFEGEKSIEICTNIIMCYINLKDIKKAEEYMKEALEIDKKDELVKELVKYFPDIKI